MRKWIGHEVGYGYNRTHLRFETETPPVEQGMAIHQGFYNFMVYGTPEGSHVRPFATAVCISQISSRQVLARHRAADRRNSDLTMAPGSK